MLQTYSAWSVLTTLQVRVSTAMLSMRALIHRSGRRTHNMWSSCSACSRKIRELQT